MIQLAAILSSGLVLAAASLGQEPAVADPTADGDFSAVARLELGLSPRQIAFEPNGARAWIAVEGDSSVAVVDTATHRLLRKIPVSQGPVGVGFLPAAAATQEREALPERLIVSRFGTDRLTILAGDEPEIVAELETGRGPGVFTALGAGRFLVPVVETGRLWFIDATGATPSLSFPAGTGPSTAGVTRDGRLAFCPNLGDGTVSVIDLFNEVVGEPVAFTTDGAALPAWATVLPGDRECAVALLGANEVALINTASRSIVGAWRDGIGDGPTAIALSPDGRLAFVAQRRSHDVSVVDLHAGRYGRVVQRFATGEMPLSLTVHPNGAELWVACEGTQNVFVHRIPESLRVAAPLDERVPATVGVLGMIHGDHVTSERWDLARVRRTVEEFRPDALLVEIPPAHFDAAWAQVVAGEPITEERTRVFPEYTDCLLHLAHEAGIEVVPCAGWSKEMSELRARRVAEFRQDADRLAAYEAAQTSALAGWAGQELDSNDPFVIHSARYDARMQVELEPYDKFMNDWIGPGGWTNVNRAHMALVHRAIDERSGQRLLVTFGAGHKYWFQGDLRERASAQGDVDLVDLRPYLGSPEPTMEATCEREVVELHQFFEDWFRGRVPATDESFARFERVMADGFEIVNPAGQTTPRDLLVTGLHQAYGRWLDGGTATGEVRVADVRVRAVGEGLFIVAYEEWQREGAEAERGRRSTAVLRRTDRPTPLGLEWLAVHETWIEEPDGR